jgi:PAS domain S-box-containing protein
MQPQLTLRRDRRDAKRFQWFGGEIDMLQVTRPSPLSAAAVEDAAIALLESDSEEAIAKILLETSLLRAEGARGAVLTGTGGAMSVASVCSDGAPREDFVSFVSAKSGINGATLVDAASAFEGAASPVTALVLPLRQRSETVGTLYVEFDDRRPHLDPQTVGALSMFARQAATSIVRVRLSESLEREADLRRCAEESRREVYDSMIKHQRIGKMGDFRFNTRTLRSRGSDQCYTIFGYEDGTDIVEYDLWMAKLHPDDRERVHEEMHAAFAKQVPLRFEYRVVVDGEVRHILSEGHPEFDRNGDLLYCGVVVDVTEQKAVEEVFANMRAELATALRLASLGELAGSVVHEVNQPLTAMIANADACRRWLSRTPANVDEAREAADHVAREGRRAAEVIAGLQSLAKGARPRFAKVDLRGLVSEVLLVCKSALERTNILARADFEDDLPEIVGDRLQLQQVIFNLVRNAAEAMKGIHDRARTLRIAGWLSNEDIILSFKDTGEGLDPERLERMFSPLFTTKMEGLGLGLSICKRIVAAHQGRIWAERNNDNGLTVSLSLPRELVADLPSLRGGRYGDPDESLA